MTITIEVSRQYPWAILPAKHRADRACEREAAAIYAEHFRYVRRVRSATACPPWVMGQELGWIISSPVDVTMDRLDDIQFGAESDADMAAVGHMLDRTEVWQRGSGWIATKSAGWLRFTQFRGYDDGWEAMFVPNGQGSVEWRLGWSARIPDDMFLLFMGLDNQSLQVPMGIMTAKHVNRTAETGGMSIAVRPVREITITRGTPIARMVLLHRDTLQARFAEMEP